MIAPPNFDLIARPYRWLEYLTLGPLLERTRKHHLARLQGCSQALILGDGDGRFTARLLTSYPQLRAETVDLSGAMLELLRQRCAGDAARLETHQTDARSYTPRNVPDLVVTHFFLDCLAQAEVEALVARLSPLLAPETLWLVSDFCVPDGPLHWPVRVYVRLLYIAFRLLTGLRTTQLPDHASPLRQCGFRLLAEHRGLFGVVTSQLWQR